jgi:hypothetical protein
MDNYIYREYNKYGIQEYRKIKTHSISSRYYTHYNIEELKCLNGRSFTFRCTHFTGSAISSYNKNPSIEFLETKYEVIELKRNISLKNILE